MLFKEGNRSLYDFYYENSYGKLQVRGEVLIDGLQSQRIILTMKVAIEAWASIQITPRSLLKKQ